VTLRLLTSFAFFREHDMGALYADLCALHSDRVELFADSGAFTAATTGAAVDLDDYAAWLHRWRHVLTTAATLDVIGDPAATARNTEALEAAGLPVLPTFHVGTPWPVLEALCARYRYLALGGMVPHYKRRDEVMRWLVKAFRTAQRHGTVFHGFGQTNTQSLALLPFYSVDSSSWIAGCRYGKALLWDPGQRRIVQAYTGDPITTRRHAELLQDHGLDPVRFVRPGFAHSGHRTPEDHRAEYDMLRGACARAFHRAGAWLSRWHNVPAPPGRTDPGTCLFLAVLDDEQARFLAALLAPTPAEEVAR
jgi:hypothetical protein